MFADDVMVFVKPTEDKLRVCARMLDMFGQASGLRVNLLKSAALPIRCTDDDMMMATWFLGCPAGTFPCQYLGLPLTTRKQTVLQFASLVDQLVACLPTRRASSLPKSGCLLLALSEIPIHAMMALDIPLKTLAATIKICRGFLWCGKAKANGGNCTVAWDSVCAPKWTGGLGIPNLGWLNVAMQASWPWLQWTDTERLWHEFQIRVPSTSLAIFKVVARTEIGDGRTALF